MIIFFASQTARPSTVKAGETKVKWGNAKVKDRTIDAGNMTSVAQTLSDVDIENLAHYITSLR